MSANFISFEGFTEAGRNGQLYPLRSYGIYYRGEVYWDRELPRKKGTLVRFAEDPNGPCLTLLVFDLDGQFLCNAWPVSWEEDDHPAQHEIRAWLETLSPAERAEIEGGQ